MFAKAGFPPLHIVTPQADPDPDFPTVTFPNPEEPGALDLALAEAARVRPDVLIANDPDADRLGAAIPEGDGYRPLRGDELGVLLADHVLRHTSGSDRLVATTVVSSTMLSKMAAAAGVQYAETLTGFKWIARAALDRPGTRFVFGYEEALGYLVGDVVRDKDGISAAMILAEIAALAKAEGVSLQDRLDDLSRAHGLHATDQWSVRLEGADGAARIASIMDALRREPAGRAGGAGRVAAGRHRDAAHRGRSRGRAAERHRAQAQDVLRGGDPGDRLDRRRSRRRPHSPRRPARRVG